MRWAGRAALLAFTVACQSSGRSSTGAATQAADGGVPRDAAVPLTRRQVTLPSPPVELPRQESFRVLSAGAAPRRALRYAWKEGERTVTAQARIRSRQLVAGRWTEPVAAPTERIAFAITRVPGDATVTLRGLPGDEAGARWRTLVSGQTARASIDPRGQLGPVTLVGATRREASADEITQRWLATAVPLPDEPIGRGARWRVVTVLQANDAIVKQTAEYTLVSVRRDAWIIDVLVRRVGEAQTIVPDGLPRGSVAELVALFRQVEGRVTVAHDLPWPRAGTLEAEVRVHARIAIPGRPVEEHVTEDLGDITLAAP